MSIVPRTDDEQQRDREVVTCPLCGTRLRANLEPGATEVGSDSRMSVARHRCAPRVQSHAPKI
jgi:hypothetical protein